MIAAMIDGVWLRAALSGWREADSESARALLTAFVDGRLAVRCTAAGEAALAGATRFAGDTTPAGDHFASINPATGEVLGYVSVAGAAQINAAVRRRQAGSKGLGLHDRCRARPRTAPRRGYPASAQCASSPSLKPATPASPFKKRSVVDVASGADCFEYFAGLAQSLERRAYGSGAAGLRLHAARAAGRRRRHRRLELSAANRLLESGAGAGLRQRHDFQARRTHALHGGEAGGNSRGSRIAAGRLSSRARVRRDRPAADSPSARFARSP